MHNELGFFAHKVEKQNVLTRGNIVTKRINFER